MDHSAKCGVSADYRKKQTEASNKFWWEALVKMERGAFYTQSQTKLLFYSLVQSTFCFSFCLGGGGFAVSETAPCNDATHGSVIIVTVMGLDGITGGDFVCAGDVWFISSEAFSSASTRTANAGVNYQLIAQTEAISLFCSDYSNGRGMWGEDQCHLNILKPILCIFLPNYDRNWGMEIKKARSE